ncbi:MAG TPA: PilZ domain-containing protein [Gammaproteobacteria bacterium]|nr:PilZ domain-containing protein [Gammaproteobacteria bacterium]
MRRYIRHPSDIPIEVDLVESHDHITENLVNVSVGGLSFHSKERLSIGKILKIKISFVQPAFETKAKVVWCEYSENNYEIGVELLDQEDAYRTRMVEQVCHIEHYKREVESVEGRQLSGAEAAVEWIQKFGHEFPRIEEPESV